jgi:hypothetical protein
MSKIVIVIDKEELIVRNMEKTRNMEGRKYRKKEIKII